MAKRSGVSKSLGGLRALAEALGALRRGRVDVGYFAGHAARTPQGGAGSKPGFYKPGTSAATIKALKAGQRPEQAQSNPEVAAKMEFGVKGVVRWTDKKGYERRVNGIPPRSTLRVPFHLHGDRIVAKAKGDARNRLKDVAANGKKAALLVLTRLGVEGENLVQEAYDSRGFGTWAPNSPETIEAKGSDAPLIDEGQLRRSVDSRVVA